MSLTISASRNHPRWLLDVQLVDGDEVYAWEAVDFGPGSRNADGTPDEGYIEQWCAEQVAHRAVMEQLETATRALEDN